MIHLENNSIIKNSATLIRNKPWFNTDVQKKCFEFLGLHPNPRELNTESSLLWNACCLVESSPKGEMCCGLFCFQTDLTNCSNFQRNCVRVWHLKEWGKKRTWGRKTNLKRCFSAPSSPKESVSGALLGRRLARACPGAAGEQRGQVGVPMPGSPRWAVRREGIARISSPAPRDAARNSRRCLQGLYGPWEIHSRKTQSVLHTAHLPRSRTSLVLPLDSTTGNLLTKLGCISSVLFPLCCMQNFHACMHIQIYNRIL